MSEAGKSDAEVGYSRDRSFYSSRPNSDPKQVHRESPTVRGMAACNTTRILLYLDMPWNVSDLRAEGSTLLCRRCWPSAYLPAGEEGPSDV